MGFIGLRTCILALILVITLVRPALVHAGVNASSAMLPEQRTQPAKLELEVPLPAAPQARIFHPTIAASVVAKPTPTLPFILLVFFLPAIIA